jgi:hypothetical protein
MSQVYKVHDDASGGFRDLKTEGSTCKPLSLGVLVLCKLNK